MAQHDLDLIRIWNSRLEDMNLVSHPSVKRIYIYKLGRETSPPIRCFPGYWLLRVPLDTTVSINPWGSLEIDLRLAVQVPKGYMVYMPYTQLEKHSFAMQIKHPDGEMENLGMQQLCIAIYNYGPDPVQITAGDPIMKMWFLECVTSDDLRVSVLDPE